MAAYDEDLAYIHDQGFSRIADAAATSVLALLPPRASIVDLGCGSGVTAGRLADAGHQVVGIDQSVALIALARRRAPGAAFRVGSFVSEPIPECDAVLAVGEVFNYLFDAANTRAALPSLFARIHAALRPGGLLVFDLAAPGVVPGGRSRNWTTGPDWAVLVENHEEGDLLTRHITSFRERGDGYRRSEQVHHQRLHRPREILALLRAAGFRARTRRRYGEVSPGRGRHVYVARKPGDAVTARRTARRRRRTGA
jgi:SAM-dependent methyltransferase